MHSVIIMLAFGPPTGQKKEKRSALSPSPPPLVLIIGLRCSLRRGVAHRVESVVQMTAIGYAFRFDVTLFVPLSALESYSKESDLTQSERYSHSR